MRFGFRLLYNEMAFTYDRVSKIVSLGAWREWQRTALDFLPSPECGLILELAHGTGDLQLDLHAQGYETIGYDLSPYMGRIASRKLQKRGISPVLVRGLAQQLPFAADTFPAIVCTFPTRFIFEPTTLTEIHRILQNEAYLIAVLNGQLTGRNAPSRFIEWLYKITGQRAAINDDRAIDDAYESLSGALLDYGFSAELRIIPCATSKATVLLARKIPLA